MNTGLPTFDQVDGEILKLLNQPDSQEPSREVRLALTLAVIDTLVKETKRTNKPQFIGSFPLIIQQSQVEYPIPVDDFAGLYYVRSTVTGYEHEVDPINFPDANLNRVDFVLQSAAPATVLRISTINEGDDERIRVFPRGANDTLEVFYHKKIDMQPDGADFLPVLEDFHWVLVPAAVALMGKPYWNWPRFDPQMQQNMKDEMSDINQPWSIAWMAERQRGLFLEHAFNPTVVHPTTELQGHGAVRRRLRRRVIR